MIMGQKEIRTVDLRHLQGGSFSSEKKLTCVQIAQVPRIKVYANLKKCIG